MELPDGFIPQLIALDIDDTLIQHDGPVPREAVYAIAQVQGKPWYDGRHLLLLGHSEGGYTVAQKAYAQISAAAVSGYWCTLGLPVAFEEHVFGANGGGNFAQVQWKVFAASC